MNKAIRTVDDTLKFIQQNFNVRGSVDFSDILQSLLRGANVISGIQQQRALYLASSLKEQKLLLDIDSYKKFDELGNFGFGQVNQVYRVADSIIHDIRTAREWIADYQKWLSTVGQGSDNHARLVELGKAILGRAIELCPIDTGFLRSTGLLIDMQTYIVIAFAAPYASYVHENLNVRHRVGQAKFLEVATQEFFPNRAVWTEITGKGDVRVEITLSPDHVTYTHYGSKR